MNKKKKKVYINTRKIIKKKKKSPHYTFGLFYFRFCIQTLINIKLSFIIGISS